MSKANGKANPPTAQDQAAQAASAPADNGAATVVPATEAAATEQAATPKPVPDEQLVGYGGLYTRVNGATALLHRTAQPSTKKDAQ